jgi:hypothetical protein
MARSIPLLTRWRGAAGGWRTVLWRTALACVAILLVLQLVPYGWRHDNPPDKSVPTFSNPQAAALVRSACADCHSNRTNWPAWSFVAPLSWYVRGDVESGREEFNLSDWGRYAHKADDAAEAVSEGSMPPTSYTLLHPHARLSAEQKRVLIDAFEQLARQGP